MLKVEKFSTKNQDIWFGSDFHWNHNPKWPVPIWKQRGFASLEESNKFIIDRTNELVKPDDYFFHLGDLTLNCSEEQGESLIDQLNCRNVFLLFGNHPSPWNKIIRREWDNFFRSAGIEPEGREIYPFRYKNVVFLGHYAEIQINGKLIVLSHYPLSVHNYCKHGAWNLCGHSHNSFKGSQLQNKDGKILDVGFDVFRGPVKFQEIEKVMSEKNILVQDHHGRE